MTDLILEPKPTHGSAEWLAARHRDSQGRARLTASVAGVLFDCHPFIKPVDLAAQQLQDQPFSAEITAAMERGTALEPSLLDYWGTKHNAEVVRPVLMYARGRWVANLDGLFAGPVEAKTTTKRFDGELPDYWRWQGVAQRWCYSGDPGWVHWVILDGGLGLHFHDQHVEAAEIDELVVTGDNWLDWIDSGMVPVSVDPKPKRPRRSFDRPAFRAAYPDLYEQFLRVKGEEE